MSDIMAGKDGGYSKDSSGNFLPSSKKRSSFESKGESPYGKGDYAKKNFGTKEYAKKSWWGDTKYQTKKFEGDTDGSRFQAASKYQGEGARESSTVAKIATDYKTSNYKTSSAHETEKALLAKPSDAETDVRRRVYTAPSVIDWREQRSMSVNETKGILGR